MYYKTLFCSAFGLAALAFGLGCKTGDPLPSGASTPPPPVAVTLGRATALVGATQTLDLAKVFAPTVTGTTNTAVTWTVDAGSLSQSDFTAPATETRVTVKATSQADTTKSATATLEVRALGNLVSRVRAVQTGTAVSGAPVRLYDDSGAPYLLSSTTTGADGTFTLRGPRTSGLRVEIDAPGFAKQLAHNQTIAPAATAYMEQVPLIPTAQMTGNGSASGHISSAATGLPMPGLTLALFSGVSARTTGTPVATTTTDANGNYTFPAIPAGYYTAQVSGVSAQSTPFTLLALGGTSLDFQNYSVSPALLPGQVRFVLTWGATPYDLDSHLTGPKADGSGNRFHVYFADKHYTNTTTSIVDLDVDDTTSYGPETTTISVLTPGVYRYYIHDYSHGSSTASPALGASGATVKVYTTDGLKHVFYVPGLAGNLWKVIELTAAANGTWTLAPINEVSDTLGTANLPLAPGAVAELDMFAALTGTKR